MAAKAGPLVSVCMPAYNVSRFLREALVSIVSQTYRRIEVILVDDGSTDETFEVARSFRDDRIRLFRNSSNLGGYQTMNKAVSLARGDLVAIYHADDVYERAIVEKEVTYLRSHPHAGAVFCLDHYIDDASEIISGTTLPAELCGRETIRYEDVFPFLLRNKNTIFRCPTFMARREVLDAVGPFDAETYDIAADVDMWIRIVRRFPIGILNERLMYYRAGGGQWSTRYNYLRTDQDWFFVIMDRYLAEDQWRDRLDVGALREYAFHQCDDETFRAINWLFKGDPDRAAELLRHGFCGAAFWRRPTLPKIRLLALRTVLWAGLQLYPDRRVSQVLHYLAYRRRFVPCLLPVM
jgi:glycosyltransferase involved in cell wall biosynthesis